MTRTREGARTRTRGETPPSIGAQLPPAPPAAEAWEDVYKQVFAREPADFVRTDVAWYRKRGIDDGLILCALKATADAPRPSWRYATAIMQRCLNEECMTAEGFAARSAAHVQKWARQEPQKQQQKTVLAQQYTQRDYTREELDQLIERI